MKINFMLFITSVTEQKEQNVHMAMMKTFESDIRPVQGDLIDDPGFDPKFHNGYEVVKVTMNYAAEQCWVSLTPIAIGMEEINIEAYLNKLEAHGWRVVSNEEMLNI